MKPIVFNGDIICYKTKYNSIHTKQTLIDVIENNIVVGPLDNYKENNDYNLNINGINLFVNGNKHFLSERAKDAYSISDLYIKYFEDIIKFGANECEKLFQLKNKNYTHIHNNIWINRINAKNPVQLNSINNPVYHTHTELRKRIGDFVPEYTFVYYIQMPNNLSNSDGMLLMKNKKDEVFHFLPEENDLIIMDGDLPHTPMFALNSTLDRLVLAGNIGFTYMKENKTLF